MNPNQIFWTGALTLLGAIVLCGAIGWREARAGRYTTHRTAMQSAIGLVALFLVSYLVKVAWIGREVRDGWPPWGVPMLRVHETAIAVMLTCGAIAWFSRRKARQRHYRAGKAAVAASLAALVTGGFLLVAMSSGWAPAPDTATTHSPSGVASDGDHSGH